MSDNSMSPVFLPINSTLSVFYLFLGNVFVRTGQTNDSIANCTWKKHTVDMTATIASCFTNLQKSGSDSKTYDLGLNQESSRRV